MDSKQCNKCGLVKPLSDFGVDRHRKDGLHRNCRACNNIATQKWKQANQDKVKLHNAAYRQRHSDERNTYNLQWARTNVDRMRTIRRRSFNKSCVNAAFKLSNRMRVRLWSILRCKKAGRTWQDIVGYSADDLRRHLESRFLPGMSWDNIGEWHIDHIIPISFFEYTSTEDQEFQYCWSLDNLQPLWAEDNLIKHDRLDIAV